MVWNGAGPFISSCDKRILTLCLFSAIHTCLSLVAAAQTFHSHFGAVRIAVEDWSYVL